MTPPSGALFRPAISGCPDIPIFIFMQLTNQDRTKIHLPHFGPPGLQSHIVPHERLPDESSLALPTDFSIAFDPSPFPSRRILPRFRPSKPPSTGLIPLNGQF